MSAPRAQRFENKYGSETDAEKRVNSSMEHKKSNKMEREEYNAGPPLGKKVPEVAGLFSQRIGWRVMFAALTSKARLIVRSSTSIEMLGLIPVPSQQCPSSLACLVKTKPGMCERGLIRMSLRLLRC